MTTHSSKPPRHLVVARFTDTRGVHRVVADLVRHGAEPEELAIIAREPQVGPEGRHLRALAVVAATVAGAVLGLLWIGAAAGATVGGIAALAATAVRHRTAVGRARSYEVVARGRAVALADRVLGSRLPS